MKNLLYVLAISLLLAACGTSSSPDDPEIEPPVETIYPIFKNNWKILSDNTSVYIGVEKPNNSKNAKISDADTVLITSNDVVSLTMSDSLFTKEEYLELRFIDPTLPDSVIASASEFRLKNFRTILVNGASFGVTQEGLKVVFSGLYPYCESSPTEPRFIIISIGDENFNPLRVYKIEVDGYISSIEYIVCEDH